MAILKHQITKILLTSLFFALVLVGTAKVAIADGNPLWIRQMGTISTDEAHGVGVDSIGNVYVAGDTAGGLDGNTNLGGYDIVLVKYNKSGMKQWTVQTGSSSYDFAQGIVVGGNGDVFVVGNTSGGFDGNTNQGSDDLFLVKYDSSGVKQWGGAKQMGTSGYDTARGVAVDGSGNVYVTGYTEGDLDGNTNVDPSGTTTDLFLVKFDITGMKIWTRQMGTASNDEAHGAALDFSGNIYIIGLI